MDSSIHQLEQFFAALGSPDYGFLYLEPVLTWGIIFGLTTFVFALIVREQKTQFFGLVVIAASCLAVIPYCNKRLGAENRIVSVYQIDDSERAKGFADGTTERREMRWLYYLTAGVATGTLLVGAGRSKLGLAFSGIAVVVGTATVLYGSSAHYREAQNYYPNLRQAAPPPATSTVADRLTTIPR